MLQFNWITISESSDCVSERRYFLKDAASNEVFVIAVRSGYRSFAKEGVRSGEPLKRGGFIYTLTIQNKDGYQYAVDIDRIEDAESKALTWFTANRPGSVLVQETKIT